MNEARADGMLAGEVMVTDVTAFAGMARVSRGIGEMARIGFVWSTPVPRGEGPGAPAIAHPTFPQASRESLSRSRLNVQ